MMNYEINSFEHAYLVYNFKGVIKVKEGVVKSNRIFVAYDNPNSYHTKLHDHPLQYRYGKVWCLREEDIQTAINIIKARRENYKLEMLKRYERLCTMPDAEVEYE